MFLPQAQEPLTDYAIGSSGNRSSRAARAFMAPSRPCARMVVAGDANLPRAQEPLTDLIARRGVRGSPVKSSLPKVLASFSPAFRKSFAALCAAFNLLTLQRAWFDGSSWFI
jgi:hypothetical protein